MVRPKKPLISRRATLEMALKIIDEEGLEALSIRRLGRALNIQGISLYYHFKNKEEILLGASALALSRVRTPDPSDHDWREWLVRNMPLITVLTVLLLGLFLVGVGLATLLGQLLT